MEATQIDLPTLFSRAATVLDERRESLNQADEANHDHGDHMVEIFKMATQAAEGARGAGLAEAMQRAAGLLEARSGNGSAQVYARGLTVLAAHFMARGIGLDDLVPYVRNYLREKKESDQQDAGQPAPASEDSDVENSASSGDVLKALLSALAEWERVEASQLESGPGETVGGKAGSGLDMGYLFGVGMAYMQAKQKGGSRLDILSETVVSASPLAKVPHRHQSGVIAVRSLLEAMGE
jgi:hypothetical protein